jgi:hypothetical protein
MDNINEIENLILELFGLNKKTDISLLCFGFTSSPYGNVDEDKEVRSASFRRSAS